MGPFENVWAQFRENRFQILNTPSHQRRKTTQKHTHRFLSIRDINTENYFHVLDGWRGLSILFVLATHLLPLGPKEWKLNQTFGPIGMVLFFILSGFLITNFLIHRPKLYDFIVLDSGSSTWDTNYIIPAMNSYLCAKHGISEERPDLS